MDELSFNCGVCSARINVGSDSRSKIIERQNPIQGTKSDLLIYHIETQCHENEVHLNLVVVDTDGRYRGIKHSEKRSSRRIDDAVLDKLADVLRFGNDFAKGISISLSGSGFALCGEEDECKKFAQVMQVCFALDSYEIIPWISTIEEFVKAYGKSPAIGSRVIGLFDSGLTRQVIQHLPNTPRMELRNRTVTGGTLFDYSSNLLKMLRGIPAKEVRAMQALIETQLNTLQKSLEFLEKTVRDLTTEMIVFRAGAMNEVDFINEILERLLPPQKLAELRSAIRPEELEILAPHLVRRIPALSNAMGN